MLPRAGQEELLAFVLACGCGLAVHACMWGRSQCVVRGGVAVL